MHRRSHSCHYQHNSTGSTPATCFRKEGSNDITGYRNALICPVVQYCHRVLQAIGQHGAASLVTAAAAAGRGNEGKLRVLTHCNTGALATAAYGTALGVVRALAAAGALEHAYCTETRPYNQGAMRLPKQGLPKEFSLDLDEFLPFRDKFVVEGVGWCVESAFELYRFL